MKKKLLTHQNNLISTVTKYKGWQNRWSFVCKQNCLNTLLLIIIWYFFLVAPQSWATQVTENVFEMTWVSLYTVPYYILDVCAYIFLLKNWWVLLLLLLLLLLLFTYVIIIDEKWKKFDAFLMPRLQYIYR